MSDKFIVDNDFIMAAVCFDDDCQFEWEAKNSDPNQIITSLILEIKVLKDVLSMIKERQDLKTMRNSVQ